MPALHPPHKIHGTQFKPLFRFGGRMTLTNLISPLMLYLDRFVIGAVLFYGSGDLLCHPV